MNNPSPRSVFVTGSTGYMGCSLIPALLRRGHTVRALARAESRGRVPDGCDVVIGDPLDRRTFEAQIAPADTLVHLVGTPRPSPAKARQFLEIDLVSAREAVAAAVAARVSHFVYVSVAQPAPIMQAYLAVRAEGEAMIRKAGLRATILRPWYVLGPGHRWPHLLRPAYAALERIPSTREQAQRLGLVTLRQMIGALVAAIENPPDGVRIVAVPEIRRTAVAAI
jgi:nucleoside-diphosphate-sugar epimerase